VNKIPTVGGALSSNNRVNAVEAAEPDDGMLVRLAQAGDARAFGELVDRHRRAVFRAALAAVGSPAEAEDVAQEAFVTAFQKLDTFRGEARFKTWLLAITWRKAIDRRKSVVRWMQRFAVARAEDETNPVDNVPETRRSQEQTLMGTELQRELRRLIYALPRKLRDALLLAGCGEYSYDEIASMLAIPVGTLKWRVSEARRVLRVKLEAKGLFDVR
jgi:RNA polymerase sigma-70 factor, ECF subfamily